MNYRLALVDVTQLGGALIGGQCSDKTDIPVQEAGH